MGIMEELEGTFERGGKRLNLKMRIFLCLVLVLENCLVVIHESSSRVPIQNGFEFRCGKKSKYENAQQCKDAYISRRLYEREKYFQNSQESTEE